MYPIGAYIVKSTNGVCKIKDIVNPDFVADSNKLYYKANLSEEKDEIYQMIKAICEA